MKVAVFFDGGNRKNDAIAAGAAVIYRDGVEICAQAVLVEGVRTNNEVEYLGLLTGLRLAAGIGATEVDIYGDSELVVRQVRGDYQVRKDHLRPLRDEAWELARAFKRITINETPRGSTNRRRDNNARADELCNDAMDLRCSIQLDEVRHMQDEERGHNEEIMADQEQPSGVPAEGAEKMEEVRTEEHGFVDEPEGDVGTVEDD
jgi:ribonuclease HI